MHKYIPISILFLYTIFFQIHAYAGGVALGGTRIIYPSDQKEVTIKTYNSDEKNNFLIQSWVSDENGNKINDFIVTPPLFVLKANTNNILKIVYVGEPDNIPKDKEKLFYFNSKAIPSIPKEEMESKNALLISTTTKVKLFMRPAKLISEESLLAYEKLKCSISDKEIKINNPSPYYVNLVELNINKKQIKDEAKTVPPFSEVTINNNLVKGELGFSVINDYGVRSKNKICKQ